MGRYDNRPSETYSEIKSDRAEHGLIDTDETVSGSLVSESSRLGSKVSSRRTEASLSDLFDTIEGDTQILPDNHNFPSVIRAGSVFDNPLGEWYVYHSEYSTDTIHLSFSDDITGPYTHYGAVLTAESWSNQCDAPHVIYTPENGEMKLYYHESDPDQPDNNHNQQTWLATAPDTGDGTNLTKHPDNPVLKGDRDGRWDDNERIYFTCLRIGQRYIGVYRGRDKNKNERMFGLAFSDDGVKWRTRPNPVAGGAYITPYDPQGSAGGSGVLVRLGGVPTLLYNQTDGNNESWALTLNQLLDTTDPGSPVKVTSQEAIGMGDLVHYKGRSYLFSGNEFSVLSWGGDYL